MDEKEEEEGKESGEKKDDKGGGAGDEGKKSKNKKLLYWGLGIGGAGLFVTLVLFFKGSSGGATAGNVASATPQASGYNPSDPYNQDYWPSVNPLPTTVGSTPAPTAGNTTQTGTSTTGGSSSQPVTTTTTPKPVTTTTTPKPVTPAPVKANPIVAVVQKIFPAAKGSIKASSGNVIASGAGDTNFWTYTAGPNDTVASVTSQVAKWGTDWQHLYDYRNNAAIFNQLGVGYNPNAKIKAGTKISV